MTAPRVNRDHTRPTHRRLRFAALFLMAAFPGCGGGVSRSPTLPDRPKVAVKGKVLLADGKPLADARVSFEPVFKGEAKGGKAEIDPANVGQPASGVTESDGTFSLTTRTAGDGIVPGDYRVSIEMNTSMAPGKPSPIPKSFYGEMSTLKVTVKPDATTLEPIVLK